MIQTDFSVSFSIIIKQIQYILIRDKYTFNTDETLNVASQVQMCMIYVHDICLDEDW